MENQGSVAYKLFAKLRKKYLKLEAAYKQLDAANKEMKEKYKRDVLDSNIDAEWTSEDAERKQLHPIWRNIRSYLFIIKQVDKRFKEFS